MIKKLISFIVSAILVISISACAKTSPETSDDGTIHVITSINALQEFTEAIGGDLVTVTTIIPDGTEPHNFEPSAQDIAALGNADVFVMVGFNMERWADETVAAADNDDLIVVTASEGVEPITLDDAHDEDHDHDDDAHDDGHDHDGVDPHTWLSLKNAQIQTENIKDALIAADPDNAQAYEDNYTQFAAEAQSLYEDYTENFETVSNNMFVTAHAAFGYLCRDFGLVQNSVQDVFAGGEPSAQQLAELIEFCKQNNITTIFSEALLSQDVADTLAREADAVVKPIYTIASTENGDTYLERMTDNLAAIYDSLA